MKRTLCVATLIALNFAFQSRAAQTVATAEKSAPLFNPLLLASLSRAMFALIYPAALSLHLFFHVPQILRTLSAWRNGLEINDVLAHPPRATVSTSMSVKKNPPRSSAAL
jgi:hypothetical protein